MKRKKRQYKKLEGNDREDFLDLLSSYVSIEYDIELVLNEIESKFEIKHG